MSDRADSSRDRGGSPATDEGAGRNRRRKGPGGDDAGEAEALHAWYESRRRELPWRGTGDPYRIWVSEVMLQQTRVETALRYYQPFLDRFPTIEALARADEDEVLAAWSGLGYYRRARNLHRAARQVIEGGEGLPRSREGLVQLPGVGAYTAAAVASIAFGEPAPAIDGNVQRVLARRLAVDSDPRGARTLRRLEAEGRRLMDPERPGESNQALMELGATVCRPRRPLCDECPLAATCRARLEGKPEAYPVLRRGRATVVERRLVVVVCRGDRVLLFRRQESREPLAGLWELPWVEAEGPGSATAGLSRRYGGRWRLGAAKGEARHSITYRRLTLEVREGWHEAAEAVAEGAEAGWFHPRELSGVPLSSQVGKVLQRAGIDITPDRG